MNKKLSILVAVIFLVLVSFYIFQNFQGEEDEVVVYVAHDQDYSEPILKEFEEKTGIEVKPLFDTELTKTVGLVNKLINEKSNPQADVFWNNEVSRSIMLKRKNVLKPYCSPNAEDVPSKYKGPDCHWTGFAARARVIIYNTELVEEPPDSIFDLNKSKWEDKACIANPLFGTTGSHMGAFYALWGQEEAEDFLMDLKENGLKIAESNSMVRDQVIAGECLVGLTDTDDANDGIVAGKPVDMLFPDQGEDEIGTLVIPNSVSLIKGASNTENGKKLIDYLLSREVEKKLSETKAIQMPVRDNVETPENVSLIEEIKSMDVTQGQIYEELNVSRKFVQNKFIK